MMINVRRMLAVIAILATFATVTTSTGAAQSDEPIPNGQYAGVVSLGGGFTVDVSEFAGQAGFMLVRAGITGPASLTVDGGEVRGSWSFAGVGSALGWVGPIRTTVDTDYEGSGGFSGGPGAASMAGTLSSKSTATVGLVSSTTSDDQPINELLTDVWVDCGRLYARFDRAFAAEIESQPGFDEQLQGVLYLRDGGINDDLIEEAAAIAAEAAALARDAARLPEIWIPPIPEGLGSPAAERVTEIIARIEQSAIDADASLVRADAAEQLVEEALGEVVAEAEASIGQAAQLSPRWILERAVELLEQVERLEAAIAGDCPPDDRFINLLSDAAETIVTALLDLIDKNQLDPDLLPLIARLALGTGIMAPPGPNVSVGDRKLIGPRVSEAIARHALGADGGGSGEGEPVTDSAEAGSLVDEATATDLAALAAQTMAGDAP